MSLILGLTPSAAKAQPVAQAQFDGTARIGTFQRLATMHVSCALVRGKINLAVGLDIPEAGQLQPVFDVGPFEGPTGIAGRMHLAAAGPTGAAQADFGSSGSFGNNGAPGTSFTFSAAMTPDPMSRASLQKLQAVAAVLSHGPSKLAWRVGNPRKGGPPIEATADISDAEASRIRVAAVPCKEK